jgi:hypothetical protein
MLEISGASIDTVELRSRIASRGLLNEWNLAQNITV